jgi:hypothetical protein
MALAFSSCGGGGGGGGDDVTASLDQALHGSIRSADVKLDAQLSIQGIKTFDRPVRIQASGPYIAAKGKLPQVDFDITAGSPEVGQTIQAGVLSTGDRAFLKFGSGYYEETAADVARANRRIAKGGRGRGAFAGLGLDPRHWVIDAQSKGDTTIAGVKVQRFSGKVDLKALFTDLNKAVVRSANVVGAVSSAPKPLAAEDIDRLAAVVKSPTFQIYVGKDDGLLRRISGKIDLAVPAAEQARFGGISSGSLTLSLELSDVNGKQKVIAPRDSRPIADLSKALGGIGALGAGALGGDSQGGTGTSTTPDPSQAYSDCLDKAQPDDIKALGRCKTLLK